MVALGRGAMMKSNARGFTLIELVVVMSLVVLLASAAVPSWQQWLLRSRRLEATTTLMRGLLWSERYRQAHGSLPLPEAWPAELAASPQGHYRIDWVLHDTGLIAIEATPIDQQTQDACGVLVLWETGIRDIRPLNTSNGMNDSPAQPSHPGTPNAASCWAG